MRLRSVAAHFVVVLLVAGLARADRLLPGPEKNTLAAAPNGLGAKRVAIVLFKWSDLPAQALTQAQARAMVFTNANCTSNWLREVSFGQLSLTGALRADGDVFGWYTIPAQGNPVSRDTRSRALEIMRLAAADGFNAANYDVILMTHPDVGLRSNAYAGTTGKEVAMNGMNNEVASHEVLHILGCDHSNGLRCTREGVPVAINDDWNSRDYGDPFDSQGGALYCHPNAYYKARMGWLSTSNVNTLPVDRPGTYTLRIAPLEQQNGLLCVRIPIPRNRIGLTYGWGADPTTVPLFYYLEYRQPIGSDTRFAANSDVVRGASIRLCTDIDTNHMTLLVDTNPETNNDNDTRVSFADAPLTVGETFRDPLAGVTIRTLSASATDVQVEVTIDAGSLYSQGPHMLWTRTDGTASLWTATSSGGYLRHRYYGPIQDWTAVSYQRVDASTAKMLFTRKYGLAILCTLDARDNIVAVERYGPFAGWTARSYQRLADGSARLLWSHTDGSASLWSLNGNDDYTGYRVYGPYAGWTARSYQRVDGSTAKMLWSDADGRASIWTMNGSDSFASNVIYGPYWDWTATDYERLSDGTARLCWSRRDGLGSLWTLDGSDGYRSYVQQGPFVDWSLEDFSAR